ncbi:YhfT family protein [Escherichia coli]
MRGLGFVPLIATTALATGVYAVAGFTFVYAVGYLSPNPMVAAVLGAVVISAEVFIASFDRQMAGALSVGA